MREGVKGVNERLVKREEKRGERKKGKRDWCSKVSRTDRWGGGGLKGDRWAFWNVTIPNIACIPQPRLGAGKNIEESVSNCEAPYNLKQGGGGGGGASEWVRRERKTWVNERRRELVKERKRRNENQREVKWKKERNRLSHLLFFIFHISFHHPISFPFL